MTADSSPDWPGKVPLNVGASLDKVEECRNFNLRGLLGFLADVSAILSAFISHIYGPILVKEVVDLFLVWERQVHIHTGANGAVSSPPPPSSYQSDLPSHSRRAPSLHLCPLALSGPLSHQGFLSARLQHRGPFQTAPGRCGPTEDVFRRALTVMKRLR